MSTSIEEVLDAIREQLMSISAGRPTSQLSLEEQCEFNDLIDQAKELDPENAECYDYA